MTILHSTATPPSSSSLPTLPPSRSKSTPIRTTTRSVSAPLSPFIKRDGETRTFKEQQRNERDYLKTKIRDILIEDDESKFSLATDPGFRRELVLKSWKFLVQDRERRRVHTLKVCYPEEYDEEEERQAVLDMFETEILRGCDDEDDDDEEVGFEGADCDVKVEEGDEGDSEEFEGADETNVGLRSSINSLGDEARFSMGRARNEEPCVAFSLSVELQGHRKIATKPYWGFNDKMEMVVITPPAAMSRFEVEVGSSRKRRADEEQVAGAEKKAKMEFREGTRSG